MIVEPAGRNTAPAIALAANLVAQRDRDDLMLVMPSDHVIVDIAEFLRSVAAAVGAANDGHLVTFGITQPELRLGLATSKWAVPWRAPLEFIRSRVSWRSRTCQWRSSTTSPERHYWNGGIFLFRTSAFLQELQRHAR